jgi:hypothetical protein
VTESEWLAADRLVPMLRLVNRKAHARKLRLFACACARRVWRRITEKVGRRAVEVAEKFADGLATAEELSAARSALRKYLASSAFRHKPDDGASTAYYTTLEGAYTGARNAAELGRETAAFKSNVDAATLEAGRRAEQQQQCDLLRCIFGPLPFRPPPRLHPAWLTPQVAALAQAAYDQRTLPAGTLDPARLGVLADALEEAGCTDTEILGHLRGPGPHVRGCWAVDLLLGKE